MAVQLVRHRFSVDDYHGMVRAGVLDEDDRVELIEGEIVDMTPIGLRHMAAVNVLTRALVTGCGERAIVQIQGPMPIGDRSEPQPDVVVLAPRADFYRQAPPGIGDVLLLVEVSDSSLPYDRGVKLPLYARSGIPEVWLVDLVRDRVEVYRTPGPEGYGAVETRSRGDQLVPAAFPDLAVPVSALL
jgi:Uma2 family endonuclease